MTKLSQVYKCNICGNIIDVLHAGKGQLVCCDQPMELLRENTVDAAKEKHVPVVEIVGDTIIVKVGSAEHPMEEKHYIEWIEVNTGDKSYRKFLKPGEKPEAVFKLEAQEVTARAYCNLHGHWKS